MYYEKEVKENEEKLKEMKEQNKNKFDIKKFGEVLEESHMMIPDSNNRLEQALTDLATYVESAEVQELLVGNEWYVTAVELLKENKNTNGQTRKNIGEDIVEETDVSGLQEGEAF